MSTPLGLRGSRLAARVGRLSSWSSGVVVAVALAGCGAASAPPAVSPPAASPPAPAPPFTAAALDALLRREWESRRITPAPRADDATFLRRVHLDIVGVIPTADRVTTFLADKAPDKRARVVDELLASKEYADYWAARWDEVLVGGARPGDVDRLTFRAWLREAFARNAKWDELATTLVTATGRSSPGLLRSATLAEATEGLKTQGLAPAVNFAAKFRDTPQDFAGQTARIFLGTQIQCAQCHDHKTEKWTQAEFRAFSACFGRTQLTVVERGGGFGRIVDARDLPGPVPRFAKNSEVAPFVSTQPKALDGTSMDGETRVKLARWMVAQPLFARAFVNRAWGHFLGRGFVSPVDDMRPSNPPEAPAVLDALGEAFARSGYDIKALVRVITTSEAYQLSAQAGGAGAGPLWSRFRVTPLGPEELVRSVVRATALDATLSESGAGEVDDLHLRLTRLFAFVFDVDEEMDATRYEGSVSQALMMMNGRLVDRGTAGGATSLFTALKEAPSDEARVTTLYLRTLGRPPRDAELAAGVAVLADAPRGARTARLATQPPKRPAKLPKGGPDPLKGLPPPRAADPKTAALEDLLWALLNASEFTFNH